MDGIGLKARGDCRGIFGLDDCGEGGESAMVQGGLWWGSIAGRTPAEDIVMLDVSICRFHSLETLGCLLAFQSGGL